MIDHEYTAIFSDELEETFEDFKALLEAIQEDEDGLHTVFFSRYNSYAIYTEVLYIMKYGTNLIFLEYPSVLKINLDHNLVPLNVETVLGSEIFVKMMYLNDNVEFLGIIPDHMGNTMYSYCLNDGISLDFSEYWLTNLVDQIDGIHVPEIDMAEISMNYLEIRIEKFKNSIQRVVNTGEVYEGIGENPFYDEFNDRETSNY